MANMGAIPIHIWSSRLPHVLVMFFAEPGQLDALVASTTTNAAWTDAFDLVRILGTANLDGVEPFGFADGISQPQIDWAQQRKPHDLTLRIDLTSALPGEIVDRADARGVEPLRDGQALAVRDQASAAVDTTRQTVTQARDQAAATVQEATTTVRQKAGEVGDRVATTADQARESAAHTRDAVLERVQPPDNSSAS